MFTALGQEFSVVWNTLHPPQPVPASTPSLSQDPALGWPRRCHRHPQGWGQGHATCMHATGRGWLLASGDSGGRGHGSGVNLTHTPRHWAPPLRNCSNRPHCLLIAIATAAHELLGAGGGEACWAGRRAARGASGYRQAAQVQPHLAGKVLTPCPLRAAQCPMLSLGHGCPPWA